MIFTSTLKSSITQGIDVCEIHDADLPILSGSPVDIVRCGYANVTNQILTANLRQDITHVFLICEILIIREYRDILKYCKKTILQAFVNLYDIRIQLLCITELTTIIHPPCTVQCNLDGISINQNSVTIRTITQRSKRYIELLQKFNDLRSLVVVVDVVRSCDQIQLHEQFSREILQDTRTEIPYLLNQFFCHYSFASITNRNRTYHQNTYPSTCTPN